VLHDVKQDGRDVAVLNTELVVRMSTTQNLVPHYFPLSESSDGYNIRIGRVSGPRTARADVSADTIHQAGAELHANPLSEIGDSDDVERMQGSCDHHQLQSGEPARSCSATSSIEKTSRTMDVDMARHADATATQPATSPTSDNALVSEGNYEGSGHDREMYPEMIDLARGDTQENDNTPIRETISTQAEHHVENVIHPVSQTPDTPWSERIEASIRSLRFISDNRGLESIPASYTGTFRWITQHERFSEWTKGQECLFWITGKPGSGKSTVMAQLVCSDEWLRLLKHWSHGAPITRASFFF